MHRRSQPAVWLVGLLALAAPLAVAVHAEALADLTPRAIRVHLKREAGGCEADVQATISLF